MTLATTSPTEAPLRRCIVTGTTGDRGGLVRFVVGPDAHIVPDVAGKLPGRGFWVQCRRDIVRNAVSKHSFQRAARTQVVVEEDLDRRVEDLLTRRLIDLIGMARRAGLAVQGFVKVRTLVQQGGASALIAACDGAEEGRGKLNALARALPCIDALSASELGRAFGRETAVHAGLRAGALTAAVLNEARRLRAYRSA